MDELEYVIRKDISRCPSTKRSPDAQHLKWAVVCHAFPQECVRLSRIRREGRPIVWDSAGVPETVQAQQRTLKNMQECKKHNTAVMPNVGVVFTVGGPLVYEERGRRSVSIDERGFGHAFVVDRGYMAG
jgi:hypothetical protein